MLSLLNKSWLRSVKVLFTLNVGYFRYIYNNFSYCYHNCQLCFKILVICIFTHVFKWQQTWGFIFFLNTNPPTEIHYSYVICHNCNVFWFFLICWWQIWTLVFALKSFYNIWNLRQGLDLFLVDNNSYCVMLTNMLNSALSSSAAWNSICHIPPYFEMLINTYPNVVALKKQ